MSEPKRELSGLKVYAVVGFHNCLECIFSTREKALTWIDKQDYSQDLDIEEIIIDDISEYKDCVILQE